MTVREHLHTIKDDKDREYALANIDERYADYECHTLAYAVMLAVKADFVKPLSTWQKIQNDAVKESFSDVSMFYTKQEVQQEEQPKEKKKK